MDATRKRKNKKKRAANDPIRPTLACFSPVDNSLFVNIQSNGLTLLIDGNWNSVIS